MSQASMRAEEKVLLLGLGLHLDYTWTTPDSADRRGCVGPPLPREAQCESVLEVPTQGRQSTQAKLRGHVGATSLVLLLHSASSGRGLMSGQLATPAKGADTDREQARRQV